ncbi:MAG: hypothetical protein K9L68_04970 [Spirochaetales bacterium]|nr:hypothetical protein [Spirochaetales bacterium]MCF7937930.1 hypothetical protein [Spirochaetales bacterium]
MSRCFRITQLIFASIFFLLSALPAVSQASLRPSPSAPLGDPDYQSPELDLRASPKFWGASASLGLFGTPIIDGLDTEYWLEAGGVLGKAPYYRTEDDEYYTGGIEGIDPAKDTAYQRFSLFWGGGIAQGLAWNRRTGRNLAEAFLLYRGRFQQHSDLPGEDELIFRSDVPGKNGFTINTLLTGLSYHDVSANPRTKTYLGLYGEFSVGFAPLWFFNGLYGEADFQRIHSRIEGYLPLFELEPRSGGLNMLSMYAAGRFVADQLMGPQIPFVARQVFAGRSVTSGLGGAVRGLDQSVYDAPFKAAASAEVRLNLPALGHREVVPGLLIYYDMGIYGSSPIQPEGFVHSTGSGAYVNFFDYVIFHVYLHWYLNGTNAEGKSFIPFTIAFSHHF